MEYTIQKTPHITFLKWYNKEKGEDFIMKRQVNHLWMSISCFMLAVASG
ncbi:hypothetical protein P4T74_30945 [Bacillus mycoides]|nr:MULTISPECIES: hypothetical protein [Bacillus cereus group]MED1054667.1 hypothetical protein [Bacillus mycoides]